MSLGAEPPFFYVAFWFLLHGLGLLGDPEDTKDDESCATHCGGVMSQHCLSAGALVSDVAHCVDTLRESVVGSVCVSIWASCWCRNSGSVQSSHGGVRFR